MDDASRQDEVRALLRDSQEDRLPDFFAALSASEIAHLMSRLDDGERLRLFELLPSETSAAIVQLLPAALAADVLRDALPRQAAAILDLLPSDDQADLLAGLDSQQASRVLGEMAPAEVQDVKRLAEFAGDTAGGLMATEYLAYPAGTSVAEVIIDMRTRAEEYARYATQYVYVVSGEGRLQGVVRLRDLLFHTDNQLLGELPLRAAATVNVHAGPNELKDFFEGHTFLAAPVVDSENRLVGVINRDDYDAASAEQAAQAFMRFSGIVFGEEFRSMPLLSRVGGRLSWLAVTMVLSFLAASVVGVFQGTLSQLIALAVFLPVISGMSGNAGNQAIAVSMRELSLGLVKPREITWVLAKEAGVGCVNGIALGAAMAAVAFIWKGDLFLGLVVGTAQTLSILLAGCFGGVVPLLLKRFGFDPAIASAPLLTTITDATGFFLTLGLASAWITT